MKLETETWIILITSLLAWAYLTYRIIRAAIEDGTENIKNKLDLILQKMDRVKEESSDSIDLRQYQ